MRDVLSVTKSDDIDNREGHFLPGCLNSLEGPRVRRFIGFACYHLVVLADLIVNGDLQIRKCRPQNLGKEITRPVRPRRSAFMRCSVDKVRRDGLVEDVEISVADKLSVEVRDDGSVLFLQRGHLDCPGIQANGCARPTLKIWRSCAPALAGSGFHLLHLFDSKCRRGLHASGSNGYCFMQK